MDGFVGDAPYNGTDFIPKERHEINIGDDKADTLYVPIEPESKWRVEAYASPLFIPGEGQKPSKKHECHKDEYEVGHRILTSG